MKVLPLKIAFLNVGHGDSVVILLPSENVGSNKAIVIDTPEFQVTKDFLDANKVDEIEIAIISHIHMDHSRGMVTLIEKMLEEGKKVNSLIYSTYYNGKSENRKKYKMLLQRLVELADKGIKTMSPIIDNNSKTVYSDVQNNLKIRLIYPDNSDFTEAIRSEKCNDTSIVVSIEYADYSVLIPGDLEGKGWKRLQTRIAKSGYQKQWNILKMPHHGDYFDGLPDELNTHEVLKLVNPQISIISSAQHKKYGHPDERTLEELKNKNIAIYCTQVTDKCHKDLKNYRQNMNGFLNIDFENYSEGWCPCCGDITLIITDTIQTELSHKDVHGARTLFSSPCCL